MKTMFNLPDKVLFCSKCVLSNQRPSSMPEFLHKPSREGAKYLNIKKNTKGENVCDACTASEVKEKTNSKVQAKANTEEIHPITDEIHSNQMKYSQIGMTYMQIQTKSTQTQSK